MTRIAATARLDAALARIHDKAGEGARAFLTLYPDKARAEAEAADARARAGLSLGPLDGAIVSIKDLYDVAGEPTRSGSRVHADAPAATRDAPPVRRLRAAGAVIIGKTNMTEFAFSGLGLNPHYGTPGNPFDRARVPGGSSSGGVVSVIDGMAEIAIGSDTGGSTRIPAAFCGAVGFKPTQRRISREGAFPLSPSLDSVGPMAKTVAACALADAAMAGEPVEAPSSARAADLRLGVVQGLPLQGLEAKVATDFERALSRLAKVDVKLIDTPMPLLAEMAETLAKGNFPGIEVHARLGTDLAERGGQFDPIVRSRMELARGFPAADYMRMLDRRLALQAAHDVFAERFDALVLPTVAMIAPRMDTVATMEAFLPINLLTLRNTSIANFFDLPSISLPMQEAGTAPTGFMLFGKRLQDRRVLAAAEALAPLLGG